jgi:hypothetical protein
LPIELITSEGCLLEHRERPGAAGRGRQHGVVVVDGRLVPDKDSRLIERVEHRARKQIVRARDVGAKGLQLRHDRGDVRARQRRAVSGHVIDDRRSVQPQPLTVQVQQAVNHLDAAHPDLHAVDLLDAILGLGGDRDAVESGMTGAPQRQRTAHGDVEADRLRSPRGELACLIGRRIDRAGG